MRGLNREDSKTSYGVEFEFISLTGLLTELSVPFEPLRPVEDDRFSTIVPICDLASSTLSFVEKGGEEFFRSLEKADGGLVLVERKWGNANREAITSLGPTPVLVDHPRLTIARILDRLKLEEELRFYGVHPTAIVDPEAKLHSTVCIGPFCVIGKCEIGEGSRILSYTFIDHYVTIAKRVAIREHCTVGIHSLGFVRDESNAWVRIPHVGYAVIEDDVDIFPYTVVDRGTLAETRICRGAKIGCYTWVSHNTCVGEDAMITGNVVLCGQSTIGARTWVGIGGIIKQGVHVGADVMIGLGAVVLNDVPDNTVVAGVPAKLIRGDR